MIERRTFVHDGERSPTTWFVLSLREVRRYEYTRTFFSRRLPEALACCPVRLRACHAPFWGGRSIWRACRVLSRLPRAGPARLQIGEDALLGGAHMLKHCEVSNRVC